MSDKQQEINDEIAELAKPAPGLQGEVVTFKSSGVGNVSVRRLREVLTLVGVDADEVKDMAPRNAFRRALGQMKDNRAIDKLEEDGEKIRFQLTQRDEQGDRVQYSYDETLVLDPDKGTIEAVHGKADLAVRAKLLFDDSIEHRTGRDVKLLVKRLFETKTARDLYCINRESGGTYFVPESHREFTARMAVLLRELGGRMERFPVPKGTTEGDAAVRSAVSEGIERWIEELDNVVENWDVSSRDSTHERYAQLYQQAKLKAEAWQDHLGEEAARLQKLVESSKHKMRQKITRLAAEKEQQTTAEADSDRSLLNQQDDELNEQSRENAAAHVANDY